METYTRCPTCLRLSLTRGGQCMFDNCQKQPARLVEDKARMLLALKGYRLRFGGIWMIENDDPEDYSEVLISKWDGTNLEAFRNMELHSWPTSANWTCPACGEGKAVEFGGICQGCSREAVMWERAGENR